MQLNRVLKLNKILNELKFKWKRAVVVVKWSARLPPTPTIRVRLPLKSTISLCKIVVEMLDPSVQKCFNKKK